MRVLHVNNTDLDGRGFNGYDLMSHMDALGVTSHQVVTHKKSDDPRVIELVLPPKPGAAMHAIHAIERRLGVSVTPPFGTPPAPAGLSRRARAIASLPEFRRADVVHYHLIHNRVLSVADLRWLSSLKPTVWSWHDPWAATGHCVYPMGCEGWLSGCSPCPHLEYHFALKTDTAGAQWQAKADAYRDAEMTVVVASEWMAEIAARSPLLPSSTPVVTAPYGLDPDRYLDPSQKRESRSALGIAPDEFVVIFRATNSQYKGLPTIVNALALRAPERPTTLVTVDTPGLLERLADNYTLLECGWVRDRDFYAQLLNAADVLLMPSTAEAFGLMAVEAMASGIAVITAEGTALPAVTATPEIGIQVPSDDALALREALDALSRNPELATERGRLGRELVHERYTTEQVARAHYDIYERVIGAQQRRAPR